MTKWVTKHTEYKNEGIEITLSCERANISKKTFCRWTDKTEKSVQELYKEIENEVFGERIKTEDYKYIHLSNRDLDNLIVTIRYSYPPLDLTVEQKTSDKINQHQADLLAVQKLTDLIWDKKLKEIEGDRSSEG